MFIKWTEPEVKSEVSFLLWEDVHFSSPCSFYPFFLFFIHCWLYFFFVVNLLINSTLDSLIFLHAPLVLWCLILIFSLPFLFSPLLLYWDFFFVLRKYLSLNFSIWRFTHSNSLFFTNFLFIWIYSSLVLP